VKTAADVELLANAVIAKDSLVYGKSGYILEMVEDIESGRRFEIRSAQYERALLNWLKGLYGLHSTKRQQASAGGPPPNGPRAQKKGYAGGRPPYKPSSQTTGGGPQNPPRGEDLPIKQEYHLRHKGDLFYIEDQYHNIIKRVATTSETDIVVLDGWHENSAMIFWHPILKVCIFNYEANCLADWMQKGYKYMGSLKNSLDVTYNEQNQSKKTSRVQWLECLTPLAAAAASLV